MSQGQLKRELAENDRLKADLEATQNIVKVSESISSLKEYIEKTQDPWNPATASMAQPNPWTTVPPRRVGCLIL